MSSENKRDWTVSSWCLGRTWQPRRVWSTPVLSTLTLSVLTTALLQQHFSDEESAHTGITYQLLWPREAQQPGILHDM